jgi:hypothetical protein
MADVRWFWIGMASPLRRGLVVPFYYAGSIMIARTWRHPSLVSSTGLSVRTSSMMLLGPPSPGEVSLLRLRPPPWH